MHYTIKTMFTQNELLRSLNHNIYGITVDKTTLTPLDTKGYVDNNSITAFAYRYHSEQQVIIISQNLFLELVV